MANSIKVVFVLFLALISLNAFSRTPVPIIDHVDIPVLTTSGKQITSEQVRDAIIFAAKVHNWEISRSPSQPVLSAMLSVRGKHTVTVTIPYSTEKFSVMYANSTNMKYGIQEQNAAPSNPYVMNISGASVRVIHPSYNTWVQDLLRAIQIELKKL